MKIKVKWCVISQKTAPCAAPCPQSGGRWGLWLSHDTAPCHAGCWQAFVTPFLGFLLHRPCVPRALESSSRRVAALCCGCSRRFGAKQLPAVSAHGVEQTKIPEKVSFVGCGLTVRRRGNTQNQIHWTCWSEPEGKGRWGFALAWKPTSAISTLLMMEAVLVEAESAKLKVVAFYSLWFCYSHVLFWFVSRVSLTSSYRKACGRNNLTLSEALNWLAASHAMTLVRSSGRKFGTA